MTESMLQQFLKQARASLAGCANGRAVTLVIGNESADLDSCVSSIAFAALSQLAGGPAKQYIPVYNVDRADVVLRKELAVLLPRAQLQLDDLICRDELPASLQSQQTTWALVDHNHFRVKGFSPDRCTVEAVVDHHVDEGLYKDARPRLIQESGSCSTLIVSQFRNCFTGAQGDGLLSDLAALIAPVVSAHDSGN